MPRQRLQQHEFWLRPRIMPSNRCGPITLLQRVIDNSQGIPIRELALKYVWTGSKHYPFT
jgi:hypothetical protein